MEDPRLQFEKEPLKIRGIIAFINPTRAATDKFNVRDFGLDCTRIQNGMPSENYVSMQCSQAKTAILDKFNIGDEVIVSFSMRGQLKTKEGMQPTEKNQSGNVVYTNIEAWRIEMYQSSGGVEPTVIPDTTTKKEGENTDDLPF